jgi:hypothetical protein
MPAKSYPAQPIFADPSERVVWQALVEQLPADAVVVCNFKILEAQQEYEMDLIVLWSEVGVAVIEVKGGDVIPNTDATFTQRDAKGSREIDPMGQATKNMYELGRFLAKKSSIQHFAARPVVALPYADIPSTYSRPTIPRSSIHDDVDLATIGDRIMRDLLNQNFRPTALQIHAILSAMSVSLESQKSLTQLGAEREKQVADLTEEQYSILDLCKAMPKFSILGSAGCGKTFVAIEQARRRLEAGDRVLFLCYNYGLSDYIRRRFENLPESPGVIQIGTLHSLGNKWNMPFTVEQSDDFWDSKLPALLVDHLATMPLDLKYDTVVIDEAQDFHADWWSVVIGALKDADKGRIYAFGDIRQGIFRQATDIPLQDTKLHLTKNFRNSLPIAELAALCVEEPLELSGLDGPPVQWIESTTELAEKAADDQVRLLVSQGWNPGDICVLTTGSRHTVQRQDGDGAMSRVYWKKFFEEDATYHCTTTGFKGLERRAVVLAINGWKEADRKKDILYTSVTRARDLLIICGSKEEITQAGGKEFFKKLSKAFR